MQIKTFSKFFLNFSFFGAALLSSVGIFSANIRAQEETASITVKKYVCDSVGEQNTCNGRIYNLDGQTIDFNVYDVTGLEPMTPRDQAGNSLETIGVTIREGNGSQGSQRQGGYTTGNTYLVCEVVPPGYISLPRPDETTGGQQTREGDCIRFKAGPGNNVLFFINYLRALGTTASSAKVIGRVVNTKGRAVSKARVVLTDSNGVTKTAMTNSFGYYRFEELPAGETYIIGGFHKSYTLAPRVFSLTDDLTEQNLVAQ